MEIIRSTRLVSLIQIGYFFVAMMLCGTLFINYAHAANTSPKINAITPNAVDPSGEIEIVGENFGDGVTNNGRVFAGGGFQQTVLNWSANKIRVYSGLVCLDQHCG